jgi:hypothetical protein
MLKSILSKMSKLSNRFLLSIVVLYPIPVQIPLIQIRCPSLKETTLGYSSTSLKLKRLKT